MQTTFIPLPEKFRYHRELVGIVRAAGVEPPARWLELDGLFDEFLAVQSNSAQRLAEQIVSPRKGVDVAALRAQAIAEASETPGALAAVQRAVLAEVEAAMLDAYKPHAIDVYKAVAEMWNTAAEVFTTAAGVCDPEADAATMVRADAKSQAAWLTAEVQAAKLDQLTPPLLAAAQLAGVRIDSADERIAQQWFTAPIDDQAALALTCDPGTPGTLHRRQVWTAYETTTGRTRRHGALVKLGATLRALHDLDEFTPYQRPAQVIHRQQQIIGAPRGIVENVVVDPCDAEHRAARAPIDVLR
jgi:hypothetical protein